MFSLSMSSFNYYNWQSPYPVWGLGFPPGNFSSVDESSQPQATCGVTASQPQDNSGVTASQPQATGGTQAPAQTTFHIKVLNPSNKRDGKIHTLRNILQEDLNCPSKIKDAIVSQCGNEVVPPSPDMEIGYFHGSSKFWINNRLDVDDAWKLVDKSEKVTFWCTGIGRVRAKKHALDEESQESHISGSTKKPKMSKQEERRAMTEEYETKLKEKHGDTFSAFQLKLWAEMLSSGVHTDLDVPPAASMFGCGSKGKLPRKDSSDISVAVVDMVNSLSHICDKI